MFSRSPYWLPLALLASVALLSFWLERIARPDVTNGKNGLGEPDAIVENFHSTLNDKNGQPLYNLHAKKLQYYGKSNQTVIDYPTLQHLSDTDGTVRISSASATITPDGKSLVFSDQVNLSHVPPRSTQGMIVQSSRIEAHIQDHLVKSLSAVSISGPGLQATAGNFELNTITRVLKLRGRVKVQYKT